MTVTILVGTRKGLFHLQSDDRQTWALDAPQLEGWDVFHAVVDARDGMLYVAGNTFPYGGTVQRSADMGETWERSDQIAMPEDTGLTLEKTWHVRPGREPGELWLGAAPGALFRSTDGGATFDPVTSLISHPTRDRWNPGAGGMCCHSVQLDPDDPNRMYVAISAAGSFRTDDGAETWVPVNKNVAADFMPEKYPEVGQCVHKLLVHPARPERLWQQNHCGVYRSDDRGDTWERLDGNGLPSGFGFPIMIHPRDPDTAWVVPEQADLNRVTAEGRLGVYRTTDAGASWELQANGLPDQAWTGVLREASSFDALDPVGLYFGTQGGSVWVSPNEGDDWIEAASNLPPILSVEAVWE
jgi:photosystem II stability/assembly factor-like uncharacterized protein